MGRWACCRFQGSKTKCVSDPKSGRSGRLFVSQMLHELGLGFEDLTGKARIQVRPAGLVQSLQNKGNRTMKYDEI